MPMKEIGVLFCDFFYDITTDRPFLSFPGAFESAPSIVEPKLVSPNNELGFGISVQSKSSSKYRFLIHLSCSSLIYPKQLLTSGEQ